MEKYEFRTVFSAVLARTLIQKGFIVTDIKPNNRDSKRTVFVFADSKELDKAIDEYTSK